MLGGQPKKQYGCATCADVDDRGVGGARLGEYGFHYPCEQIWKQHVLKVAFCLGLSAI